MNRVESEYAISHTENTDFTKFNKSVTETFEYFVSLGYGVDKSHYDNSVLTGDVTKYTLFVIWRKKQP